MTKRCAVGGCSNTPSSNVSVCRYPADKRQWCKWDSFIRSTRKWDKGVSTTVVCSEHFKQEDFANYMQWKMGFCTKLILKQGVVPTIKPIRILQAAATDSAPQGRKSSARMKLNFARQCDDMQESNNYENVPPTDDETENEFSGSACREDEQSEPATESTHCVQMISEGIQVHVKNPQKHRATQTTKAVNEATVQCNLICAPPLKCLGVKERSAETSSASEVVTSANDVDEKLCIDLPLPEKEDIETMPVPASELVCYKYNSEDDNSPQILNVPDPRPTPDLEDKYIVFLSNLMELFQQCSQCCKQTKSTITKTDGSCIHVQQDCVSCGHTRKWTSQPYLSNMAAGNLLISSAIVLSGSLPAKVMKLFYLLNIRCISHSTFFRHQRKYMFPIVESHWQNHQAKLLQQLKDNNEKLVLIGDGRSDSPGHCAKYGTYTLIEQGINKVIDLQVVQSNEVKNASWCELEGLQRSVGFLTDEDGHALKIGMLVTDRHAQINKWVRESQAMTGVVHHFDSWHIIKGVRKKLDKLGSNKGCEDVSSWKQSIINHLWWTVSSTPGMDYQAKVDKWKSILFHIQGIHSNLPLPTLNECAHGDLTEDRKWIQPTTKGYTCLETMLGDKRLLGDVKRMSTADQTSLLKAFHSLVLSFAPKHTAFSWLGMRTRLKLAALHFNENSGRQQAQTAEGEDRYSVIYSKTKHFECRVRPIPSSHTVGYAINIQHELVERYAADRNGLKHSLDEIRAQEPPPLASKATRKTKEEAVAQHICRISR